MGLKSNYNTANKSYNKHNLYLYFLHLFSKILYTDISNSSSTQLRKKTLVLTGLIYPQYMQRTDVR